MHRRASIERLAVPFVVLLLAGAAHAETTPNLLENPGAESGTTFPWGSTDGVQEGPLMVGGAVLDATEGTRWFVADEQISVEQEGSIGYLIHYLTQTVDLRGLGDIERLTLRGDFFGAGELTAGSATELTWTADFFATFLDEEGQGIDGASFSSQPAPVGPFQAFSDLTFEIDSIPAGAAEVQLQYSGSLLAFVGPGGTLPLGVRIAIGIDDLSLTATLPEPGGAGGALAAATLATLAGRRRRSGPAARVVCVPSGTPGTRAAGPDSRRG